MATTQDKDEKESPKKKGGKDLDDLKKEVPIVSRPVTAQLLGHVVTRLVTRRSQHDYQPQSKAPAER